MQRPFIHPCAYSISFCCLLQSLLLSLLFHYCFYYKTVATDKLCRASLFPGATELIIQLLSLINIHCLPLCRINKLGFSSLEDCCDPLYLWVITHTRDGRGEGREGAARAPAAAETLEAGRRVARERAFRHRVFFLTV